jgi:hypothetical protein
MRASQPVKEDCAYVQDDECKDEIEPRFVQVPRRIRSVGADEPRERPCVDPVLVLRDEPEAHLHRDRNEHGEDAERAEWIVADPRPPAPQIVPDGGGTAHEIRETRGGASDEPPQQPEYEQRQDRAA